MPERSKTLDRNALTGAAVIVTAGLEHEGEALVKWHPAIEEVFAHLKKTGEPACTVVFDDKEGEEDDHG